MMFKLCRVGVGTTTIELHEPSFLIGEISFEENYCVIKRPVVFSFRQEKKDEKDLTKEEVRGRGSFFPLGVMAVSSVNGVQGEDTIYIPKDKILYIAPLKENSAFAVNYSKVASTIYSGLEGV